MPRAATDVMQSILFSAVLDAVAALKAASKGLPNQLLRDVQAIHPNVTFADLPKELQDAISAATGAVTHRVPPHAHPTAEGRCRPAPRRRRRHATAGSRRGAVAQCSKSMLA